jgi:hypothetical protein
LVGVQNVLEGMATAPSTIIAGGLAMTTPTAYELGARVRVAVRATGFAVTPGGAEANATLVQTIDRGTRLMARLRLDAGEAIVVEVARGIADVGAPRWRVDVVPGAAMVWPVA